MEHNLSKDDRDFIATWARSILFRVLQVGALIMAYFGAKEWDLVLSA